MKLALVTRRYPPLIGGAEKMLSYLADAFAEAGAEVVVLTSSLDVGGPSVETPRSGPAVVRLATSRLRFVGTWLYMNNLQRWFSDNSVDLAYVSMLKHDAYAVLGEARRRGFPAVLRPEGAGATGDVAWRKRGRFGSRIAERCRTADAIVAISDAVRRELVEDGYDPGRIFDLPNGVPVPAEPWNPADAEPESAAFVGRLAPEKGLHALVDAWRIVVDARPEARLTLVGDGPERAALEADVARLNLQGSVILHGASGEPGRLLRAASLFVLPSREEGMSIALLEAMALGMPIVASDIPGNRRLVTQGEHGRLVPPDDPTAIARAVLSAWSDPAGSREAGLAARRRASDEFSIRAVARRHLDLFERIVSAR